MAPCVYVLVFRVLVLGACVSYVLVLSQSRMGATWCSYGVLAAAGWCLNAGCGWGVAACMLGVAGWCWGGWLHAWAACWPAGPQYHRVEQRTPDSLNQGGAKNPRFFAQGGAKNHPPWQPQARRETTSKQRKLPRGGSKTGGSFGQPQDSLRHPAGCGRGFQGGPKNPNRF